MKLSPEGKKLLAYKIKQFFGGMITAKEYLTAVEAIYKLERPESQTWELKQYGYMARTNN